MMAGVTSFSSVKLVAETSFEMRRGNGHFHTSSVRLSSSADMQLSVALPNFQRAAESCLLLGPGSSGTSLAYPVISNVTHGV